MDHLTRGKCTQSYRVYLNFGTRQPKGARPGDRRMTEEETRTMVEHAARRVAQASNYSKEFAKVMGRGYVHRDCTCPIYHTIDLPSEHPAIVERATRAEEASQTAHSNTGR